MLKFRTREQCEQFQMTALGISCATCERLDQECPWGRQDEPTIIAKPPRRLGSKPVGRPPEECSRGFSPR
jgi:hypothetical protein